MTIQHISPYGEVIFLYPHDLIEDRSLDRCALKESDFSVRTRTLHSADAVVYIDLDAGDVQILKNRRGPTGGASVHEDETRDVVFSEDDWQLFRAMIENPTPPTEELIEAVRAGRRLLGKDA
jgi:hypothetical protein